MSLTINSRGFLSTDYFGLSRDKNSLFIEFLLSTKHNIGDLAFIIIH